MIAGGRVAEVENAAGELRDALAVAGVALPLAVHPGVWDSAELGPVRLVEFGAVLPEVAVRLAAVVRKGAAES